MSKMRQASTSFFGKKEVKKLPLIWSSQVKPPVTQMNKSFLLLFYKKEAFSFSPNSSCPA
ncbi:hypothetical protein SIL87_13695 [Acidiphilium acidophilum]|uniref:Uncharacterized protein n=1 Tax=Acidiphilium acidophilum TaxID=76588 RepID=A0AAW9DT38_ACIAO|nr:hypothetical protein [Acidiphilium acidophilum]